MTANTVFSKIDPLVLPPEVRLYTLPNTEMPHARQILRIPSRTISVPTPPNLPRWRAPRPPSLHTTPIIPGRFAQLIVIRRERRCAPSQSRGAPDTILTLYNPDVGRANMKTRGMCRAWDKPNRWEINDGD